MCSTNWGHTGAMGLTPLAAQWGMEESTIITLGWWRSLAYLDYITIASLELAAFWHHNSYLFTV